MIAKIVANGRNSAPRPSESTLCIGIGAIARTAVSFEKLPELRKELSLRFKDTLTSSVVKNADEQSLVALSAMSEAIQQMPMRSAADWGVIATPRYFGRSRCAEMIRKYRDQGAWSASPHIIPQCMLHSLSGLLSQAFGITGPNIGAGGSRGGEREALLAAFGWLSAGKLPGVWLIMTSWDSEETAYSSGVCHAVVVALKSSTTGSTRLRLKPAGSGENLEPFSLESLTDELTNEWSRPVTWDMSHVGTLHLEPSNQFQVV